MVLSNVRCYIVWVGNKYNDEDDDDDWHDEGSTLVIFTFMILPQLSFFSGRSWEIACRM